MTTTMTSSLFGLEDMEALLWAPSSPTADALMFDKEQPQTAGGGVASLEVDASPASPLAASSLSSSSSPPPFYSPPPSPPAPLLLPPPYKELLSFPWLSEPLRSSQTLAEEDDLSDLDWMDEKMDLSPFDLDSLIGSCVPVEDPAASPDDLLATLDCPVELEPLPLPLLPVEPLPAPSDPPVVAVATESCTEERDVPSSPLYVPEPQEELEIKSEPASPGVDSASSPAYTLDLGSEVDVSDTEVKPVAAPAPVVAAPAPVIPQLPRIVLSLPTTRIVLLLAPKKEVTPKVVRCSPPPSPPQRPAPRCRPYPDPVVARVTIKTPRGAERAVAKTPKDKKYKKMEQNKTAATRYRQKKRAETSALGDELAALERKNLELTERAESTEREIQYLKELMEEVSLARLRKELAAAP